MSNLNRSTQIKRRVALRARKPWRPKAKPWKAKPKGAKARAPLNKIGPRGDAWRTVWRWLKPRMEKAGRTRCEFWFVEHECGGPLDPAHSKKRREMEGDEIYHVARACRNVHRILDGHVKYPPFVRDGRKRQHFSHADMLTAVTRAINENGGVIKPDGV